MAAPAVTDRGVPAGIKLKEGFRIEYAFSINPTVSLWEKDVMPVGIDGGEPVDNTTQHNCLWRTVRPRVLQTATPLTCKSAYDPQVYSQILALVNKEGSITIWFPDYSNVSFFGYLKSFKPNAQEEGKQPEADVEIIPTNWDPVNNVEQGPIYAAASGTSGKETCGN